MSSRGVNALAARVAHAAVEGTAFVWTKDGFRAFLLVQCVALAWALGPRRTITLGVQCSVACSAAKFVTVLVGSKTGSKEHKLDSIWDFDPPGDLGDSGAWKVLKELAATMSLGKDSHDELKDLQPMPLSDLIVRLILLYKHVQENPVADSLSSDDVQDTVTPDAVETLCKYLYFADQAYDCGTESNLKGALSEHGYELNFAKLEATWAEHCPSYFVATHPEGKELLITVRGTAQIEDVITDLTALPTEFGDSGHLVHGGVHSSAVWLHDRLLSLAQAMHDAGYRVTLVGHSLGAGAAALVSMMLKGAGVDRVTCYAFAAPNCVDLPLSEKCAEYVTSVVFRDDIVARFSPESLAGLHSELQEFDVQSAMENAKKSDDFVLRFMSLLNPKAENEQELDKEIVEERAALRGKSSVGSGPLEAGGGGEEEADEKAEKRQKSYRPHIPGRVLYIYRKNATTGDESSGALSQQHELAFVKNSCRALRCIRLSDKVVTDHLIDSYFAGFGRENPSKERLARLQKEEQQQQEEDGTEKEKEQRAEQSAEDRDKDAKDQWRSWKAKLGLIS